MRSLSTVLLYHEAPDGSHYDWLLENPADPDGPLWSARVGLPTRAWPAAGSFDLEPIAAHRRAWLHRQGAVSGGRGRARRVDAGSFVPRLWSEDRIEIDLSMEHARGHVTMRRRDRLWEAVLTPAAANGQCDSSRV